MTKEEFKTLNILKQIEFINSRTITGLTVVEVAQEINISESVIRRICKKNNYVFNRADKVYLLAENNTGTPQETPKENKTPQEQNNKNYFTKEEIKGIKELLAAKKELLSIAPGNKNTISVIDILNIDRTNRKKATFNMDIEQLNRLETYNSNPNISKSDIVNIALREYIRNNQGNN
jgi:predicted DNA-binding protein YlxM (UPF0122 family)